MLYDFLKFQASQITLKLMSMSNGIKYHTIVHLLCFDREQCVVHRVSLTLERLDINNQSCSDAFSEKRAPFVA